MREYKIWDNGNKCTIINEYMDEGDLDFDYLIGDVPFGILSCNLREYSLERCNENMKTAEDIFNWVMQNKKINSFDFDVNDIVKAFGDNTYIGYESEDVIIDTKKKYSTEELKELILDMFNNDCFDDSMIYNIISHTNFDRFLIRPFYAYVHSGVSISLGDYNDPWDSRMAGFAWYEPLENENMIKAAKEFNIAFNIYNEWIQGCYNEYHICTYIKEDNEWKLDDDFWDYQKSFEDAWSCVDFDIAKEVENFSEDDKDIVRKNINIDTKEILDYLEDLE